MSDADLDAIEESALAAAIEENPEEVAQFVGRLGAVNDLLDVLELGLDAMDDEMVTELSGTAGTLAAAGDGLATAETVRLAESVGENGEDLTAALETMVELQRTGTLDDLVELANAASLATSALDDEMVVTLARAGGSLGEVADEAADRDTARGLATLLGAVGDASDPDADPERLGPWGLVKATRDPEVQYGLGYVVAIARALGRAVDADAE
ncbi:MAG: DUF1641 domain-containing protein [Halobacteriaceae archaeon]